MSSLKDTLRSDLTDAIRGRDQVRAGTLRMVLTSVTNEEVAGTEARELSDDEVLKVIAKEAKKRREAATASATSLSSSSSPSCAGRYASTIASSASSLAASSARPASM